MSHNQLALIGIHIPKTAGRSFKAVLEKHYPNRYYRINIRPHEKQREEVVRQKLVDMPKNTEVIHGHFYYSDILCVLEDNPEVPVVTWLREPVERVVSQYYFAKKKYEKGLTKQGVKIADMSLIDFAEQKINTEPMVKVLSGVDLKDIYFVGILEYLDDDLEHLSKLMGWKNYKMPKINTNTAYKSKFSVPTEYEVGKIRELFQEDIVLYNYALELRKMRLHNRELREK